jgi:hypothetical protein
MHDDTTFYNRNQSPEHRQVGDLLAQKIDQQALRDCLN